MTAPVEDRLVVRPGESFTIGIKERTYVGSAPVMDLNGTPISS